MSVPDLKITLSGGKASAAPLALPEGGAFTISASGFSFGVPSVPPPSGAVQLPGEAVAFLPNGNAVFTMTSSSVDQLDLDAAKPSGKGQAYNFWVGIAGGRSAEWFPVYQELPKGELGEDLDVIVVGDPEV